MVVPGEPEPCSLVCGWWLQACVGFPSAPSLGEARHSHDAKSCLYVSCHETGTSGESRAGVSSQLGEALFECKLDPGLAEGRVILLLCDTLHLIL